MIQLHGLVKNERIIFLDYLRIFAFVSVLIGHKFYPYLLEFINDKDVHATPRLIVEFLMPLFYGGGAGVVVFFLVSGYIISHVLQIENERDFLIKRIFRIYPLYVFAVVVQYSPLIVYGHEFDKIDFILQLLLIGDFFSVPYSLGNVEWTLRIEILFYIFMSLIRSREMLKIHKYFLPSVLFGVVVLCSLTKPFPYFDEGTYGYLQIYFPFLLLGGFFYFFEKNKISFIWLLIFIGAVFINYYYLMGLYQKSWLNEHFAILSFLVFTVFWMLKDRLVAGLWVLFLSDLTFAVYLFHNWLFDLFKKRVVRLGFSDLISDVFTLLILLIFCYLSVRCIEKPAVRVGQIFLRKLNSRS